MVPWRRAICGDRRSVNPVEAAGTCRYTFATSPTRSPTGGARHAARGDCRRADVPRRRQQRPGDQLHQHRHRRRRGTRRCGTAGPRWQLRLVHNRQQEPGGARRSRGCHQRPSRLGGSAQPVEPAASRDPWPGGALPAGGGHDPASSPTGSGNAPTKSGGRWGSRLLCRSRCGTRLGSRCGRAACAGVARRVR